MHKIKYIKIIIIYIYIGYQICPEVKVIATPGHTMDDVTVLVETTVSEKPTCFAITGLFFKNNII